MKKQVKDYYNFLQQQEGADELVGELDELLELADGFESFEEFVADEVLNLEDLDPELADKIRSKYL